MNDIDLGAADPGRLELCCDNCGRPVSPSDGEYRGYLVCGECRTAAIAWWERVAPADVPQG